MDDLETAFTVDPRAQKVFTTICTALATALATVR